jgi:chorismate mutase
MLFLEGEQMRLSKSKLAVVGAWAIIAESSTCPQSGRDTLQRLVETSARRLIIAEQVALAKWDKGIPVEDASREAQVIVHAVTAGQSRGLDQQLVSNFFMAQIEANKLVQYALLAEWRRVGKVPDHRPVDLANTIRAELDEVDTALIAELEESTAIRASASCRVEIAKAVGTYVSAHKNSLGRIKAISLNRALATACIGPLRY